MMTRSSNTKLRAQGWLRVRAGLGGAVICSGLTGSVIAYASCFSLLNCLCYERLMPVARDSYLALQKRLQGLEKSLVTGIMGK